MVLRWIQAPVDDSDESQSTAFCSPKEMMSNIKKQFIWTEFIVTWNWTFYSVADVDVEPLSLWYSTCLQRRPCRPEVIVSEPHRWLLLTVMQVQEGLETFSVSVTLTWRKNSVNRRHDDLSRRSAPGRFKGSLSSLVPIVDVDPGTVPHPPPDMFNANVFCLIWLRPKSELVLWNLLFLS